MSEDTEKSILPGKNAWVERTVYGGEMLVMRNISGDDLIRLAESGYADMQAVRPDYISSDEWRKLPLSQRTVGALAQKELIRRSYHQACANVEAAGWKSKPNPGHPEEKLFSKWIGTPDGLVLVRTILVRKSDGNEWFLREVSRGVGSSYAIRTAPDEVRFRDAR